MLPPRSSSSSSLLTLCCFAFAAALIGGCSSSHEADEGTQPPPSDESNFTGARPSALKAEIKEVPFKKTLEKCSIEVKQIEVKLANAEAAALINKVLTNTDSYNEWLDPTDCRDNSFTLEGGQTAAFNERGWLTITSGESSYYEGAAHPNNEYFVRNFDLATGKLVSLDDVLDAEGKQILVRTCKTQLNSDPDLGGGDGIFDQACEDAIVTGQYSASTYAIEKDGLRTHPLNLGHAAFAVGVEGVLVKWADLKGHITHPVVKAIANQ